MKIKTTGKISEAVLKRSVIKEIASLIKREPYTLGVGQDATEFKMDTSGALCMSTATMEGNQVDYLTCTFVRALNNVLVKGAAPYGISVSITLCKEARESELKSIIRQIKSLCEQYGVKLLGGETLVSTTASQHVFTVTVLGERDDSIVYKKGVDTEAYLVMTKTAGLGGTGILTRKYFEQLQERYTGTFLNGALRQMKDLSICKEMEIVKDKSVLYAHDVSEGGVFSALWEVGEYLNCGMTIDLSKIKLSQETIEVSEFFDINPYLLFSLGSVIFVTEDYHPLIEALKDNQIPACVIGTVNPSNDRLIINGEETRFIEPYKEDELFKVR